MLVDSKKILRKIEELFLFFLLTSFIGWGYEIFLEVVIYRWGYSDRGVLTGPYCPVYGFGAMALLLCLYRLMKTRILVCKIPITPVLVFAGIVGITTVIELAASYVMEWTAGMVFLYLLYPCFQRCVSKTADRTVHVLALILGGVFLLDCLCYILV